MPNTVPDTLPYTRNGTRIAIEACFFRMTALWSPPPKLLEERPRRLPPFLLIATTYVHARTASAAIGPSVEMSSLS